MSCAAGPDIKEDGLVLALDAANTKSILSAVEVLVVAGGGGGGGGHGGGGGGAGGLIYNSNFAVTPGSALTVTVGDGGAGGSNGTPGNDGNNSVFGSLTATNGGGGGGESSPFNGRSGGSGGGGSGYAIATSGGSGTLNQGNSGGGGGTPDTLGGSTYGHGGGGGGAGALGTNGTEAVQPNGGVGTAGVGGSGLGFNISGTFTYYAGGGGGGYWGTNLNGGSGGLGGGGRGGDPGSQGQNGTANTGGGGGGSPGAPVGGARNGGAGGSGIVIVRYPGSQRATGGTVTSVAGHTIHTFTTSGTFTPNFGDMSGRGNTGTLTNGPTYSSANGGSLSFDGTNDYVNAPLTKTATCTFSCWARTTTLASAPMLFNAGPNGVGPDLFFYLGNIYWNTWDGGANPLATTPASVTDGNYHYYVVVNDASSNTKLYYDGVLLGTATYRTAANNTNLTIGGNTDTYMWNGNISNFTIYNRALTAQEIQQNFIATRSRYSI